MRATPAHSGDIRMSLFGRILSKIFPAGHPAATTAAGETAATSAPPAKPAAPAGPNPTGTAGAVKPMTEVDVEAVLNDLAAKNPQKLNWRTSIVDLMRLVGLDSSLESRKALAQELHYTGDMNDSAAMNIWLHKQVMRKIAENGGKVPQELKS